MQKEYNDTMIVIAWPDCIARGDGKWYSILKKLGIFKNVNFKVGHAALILVERPSGKLHYFDFGRYIAPRGYGRVRGANTDPELEFDFTASFDSDGTINNIPDIACNLLRYKAATHGEGKMFFSLCKEINFHDCMKHISSLQEKRYILYGAIARGNTNCSRFVYNTILAGYKKGFNWKLRFPESIKASPIGNVVNANSYSHAFLLENNWLSQAPLNRWKAIGYLLNNVWENIHPIKAQQLPSDKIVGHIEEPLDRPIDLPENAQWLGGIGEGAWHVLHESKLGEHLTLVRYKVNGRKDFSVTFKLIEQLNLRKPYKILYGTQAQRLLVEQAGHIYESYPVQVEMAIHENISLK